MIDYLFMINNLDDCSKHFMQQPPLWSLETKLTAPTEKFQRSQRIFINKHVKQHEGQTTTAFLYFKKPQNIQDSCSEHPGGFEWSHVDTIRRELSSPQVLCLVTRGLWESNKNSSLHFIKTNKMIPTKAPVMFCSGRELKCYFLHGQSCD